MKTRAHPDVRSCPRLRLAFGLVLGLLAGAPVIHGAAGAASTGTIEGRVFNASTGAALVNARIGRVVWGCDDPKAGACTSLFTIGTDTRLNHRFAVTRGVLDVECAARLSSFFARLRAQGKK